MAIVLVEEVDDGVSVVKEAVADLVIRVVVSLGG